jgi:hypothetical protein
MLFIEKQPEEIKVGLHNLAVQQGPYLSLRTCCRSAASLSSAYDKFQQPLTERRPERNSGVSARSHVSSRVMPTITDRKAVGKDGPCRVCEVKGIHVVWSRVHWVPIRSFPSRACSNVDS